jgi:mevalonate kinase
VVPVAVPRTLVMAIGNTGMSSSTRTMVEGVARLRARSPEMVERTFDAIRSLSSNARFAVEAGDLRALGQLFDLNQMLLSGLFVSSTEIETLCQLARGAGALGAKLTGAGGGGCVVALAETDASPILAAWKEAGFEGFAAVVEGKPVGVRLEIVRR